MIIRVEAAPPELISRLHDIVRLYYPGCCLVTGQVAGVAASISIKMARKKEGEALHLQAEVSSNGRKTAAEEVFPLPGNDREKEGEARRLARLFIYRLLSRHHGGKTYPYGILTGVRPTKLVHRWLDEGMDGADIEQVLREKYALRHDKARLLTGIAGRNRGYLPVPEEAARLVSVYIGIPYCPSRCHYCSFPGTVLEDYCGQLKPFLEALRKEVEALGRALHELKLAVQCIYVGGGTPTVLAEDDLSRMFDWLHRYYISDQTVEITVEAGRPDTLNPTKLRTLAGLGVSRISVNPQTMNDPTLRLIGRNHSVEEVVRSVEWAREAGFRQINMDLIVGLPHEGIAENTNTAEMVLQLRPENITVHTLALKRGSLLAQTPVSESLQERVEEVEQGVKLFQDLLTAAGYVPYYLYRQKYMRANLENLGYAFPGQFCIYNIQVIEERQTILGLGCGAASKFVNPRGWTLKSLYNPKDPVSYRNSVDRLAGRKVDNLLGLGIE
ncbi:MAG: coproporphyrinogen dehydrogenase HemZ [Syntrophomonadaceae bacterium]|nr:coproporphyrinogen dehydrogenase HemZ [Syntrophomonadaceae bacterium]